MRYRRSHGISTKRKNNGSLFFDLESKSGTHAATNRETNKHATQRIWATSICTGQSPTFKQMMDSFVNKPRYDQRHTCTPPPLPPRHGTAAEQEQKRTSSLIRGKSPGKRGKKRGTVDSYSNTRVSIKYTSEGGVKVVLTKFHVIRNGQQRRQR